MRSVRSIVILFVLLSAARSGSDAQGQLLRPKSSFVMNVDFARFKYTDSVAYFEVYYNFYPRLVTLEQSADAFRGAIQVVTQMKSRTTGEYVVNSAATIPVTVTDTSKGPTDYAVVTQVGYGIPFGEYNLVVRGADSLDGARADSVSVAVSLAPYRSHVAMSDIELCSSIKSSTDKSNLFYKNGCDVVPNPSLVFGATANPLAFRYTELYNLDPRETYVVQNRILDATGKVLREVSSRKNYGVQDAIEIGSMVVSAIPSGKYRFQLSLADTNNQVVASTERDMYIYNPQIKNAEFGALRSQSAALAGMTGEELAAEFATLQYFVSDQEIKNFSQITSDDGRRRFLSELWSEVEAGRQGRPPVSRAEYLRRVSSANARFHAPGRGGWRSDRGRVFLLYGEPDDIERYPSKTDTKPYEIWHYYHIESGVEFDFVDRSGFGDYLLVNSTKRGEIADDQWQQNYLQQ